MNALKRGCLELLIIWSGAGYGLYYYFHERFEPPGDIWGAVIGGLLLSMSWGAIRNISDTLKRKRLLMAAQTGERPQDGKLSAAAGTITAIGDTLRTPFQQKECVIYGYDISVEKWVDNRSSSSSNTEKKTYMGGYAMCPYAIRTPIENVKVLGFTVPHAFPEESLSAPAIKNKVLEYAASTKFEDNGGLGIRAALHELKGVLSEQTGTHRYDWKTGQLESALEDPQVKIMEQCVPVGAQVCVIGTYSAQKGGLLNDYNMGGMEMLRGSLSDAIRALRMRAIGLFVLALFFAAAGSVGAFAVLTLREHRSADIISRLQQRFVTGIRDDNLSQVETTLNHGLSPNSEDSNMEESVGYIHSKAMLDLLMQHGFDINRRMKNGHTPLLSAVELRKRDLALWLIDAGADVKAKQADWNTTVLEKALDSGDQAIAKKLRERGAQATFVTQQNGSAISAGAKSAVLDTIAEYLRAFTSTDTAALRAVTDDWPKDFFDSFASGLYRNSRSCTPLFQGGFENASAATVSMACTAAQPEIWTFTLVKRGDRWKVRREAWSGN